MIIIIIPVLKQSTANQSKQSKHYQKIVLESKNNETI